MEKVCIACKLCKPTSDFYKHPKMADGFLGRCKTCHKSEIKKVRELRKDYYAEFDKARANEPKRVAARKAYAKTDAGKASHKKAIEKQKLLHPEKTKARYAVANAIKNGKIEKKPCAVCGENKAYAHHHDYSRPLDVVWLCAKHHAEAHKNNQDQS